MLRLLPSLFTKKIAVFVSAESIAVINNASAFSNNNTDRSSSIFTQATNQLANQAVWQHAINQLDGLLGEFLPAQQIKPNAPLQIVLGSDLVRYVALPAQAISMNLAEKNAYASAAFKEIHGTNANDWQVVCDDAAPQQAIVAAAIDKKLLQNLSQLAVSHQLKLKSVKPYLMVAMNGLAKQLAKTTAYLAIVEHSRITLILLQQGQYQQLHSHAIGSDWQAELKHLLMRESVLSDVGYRNVFIVAPIHQTTSHQTTALITIDGWHITHLDQNYRTNGTRNKGMNIDSRYAMLEAIV